MIRALIIENNMTFRESFRQILNVNFPSMLIQDVEDAEAALQAIELHEPDLIFVNMQLPGANGLQLTRKLSDRTSQATIVVLASHDLPEYREAAFQHGAHFLLLKESSTIQEVFGTVESVFSKKGLAHSVIPISGTP